MIINEFNLLCFLLGVTWTPLMILALNAIWHWLKETENESN